MEFFNHIHCKYTGIRGFLKVYNDGLRFRYMIREEAIRKVKILTFWKKYGLEATIEAFKVKRSTLYLWQKKLKENKGRIEALNNKSRVPKNKRKRIIDPKVKEFIIQQRNKHPRLGKEKLALLLKQERIANLSPSIIGRIIKDLKEKGIIPQSNKISFYAKTDRFIERKPKKPRRKLRRKGYIPEKEGDLLQIDTIVIFINGLKRYILTSIDLKSSFGFALAYSALNSQKAKDFFSKLEKVSPFSIKRIQTDNGLEFEKHFRDYLEKKNIIHFYNYPRHPQANAYIERFNRTLQEEFINHHKDILAYDLERFNQKLMEYLVWYNTKRPHWSLNLKSPLRYIIEKYLPKESNMLWTNTNS